MYGRDRERALLRELLDDAVEGQGGLVLISGEAGIGKTMLVDDLNGYADERGCLVLSGGCYDLTTTPPYGPWVEVIRDYEPPENGPDVPSWFGNPDGLEQVGSQAALFDEARAFFAEVADSQPLVLVLEDLHWADPASLDALRYLGRTLADQSILLVVTYRDDEITRRDRLAQLLPSLVREAGAVRLSVTRLGEDALTELIAADYQLDEDDLQRLVLHVAELSEGNPLYVIELLQTLEDEGMIRRDNDHHTVGELNVVSVPPLIQQIIERRLDRLEPSELGLLEVAAVIGQAFAFQTWLAVSEADESTLLETLEAAQHRHLVEEIGRSGRYRFHHALIREALYERQMWPERRRLHRQVGEVLIQQACSDPDTVAHHFQEAGDDRAVEWLVRAGERAVRSFAWMVAADHYIAAIRLFEHRPDSTRRRAELLDRLAMLFMFEDPRRGLSFSDEALRTVPPSPDDPLAVSLQVHRGLLRCHLGQMRAGIAEMQAALDGYRGDPAQLRPATSGLAMHDGLSIWLANTGHLNAARELWEHRRSELDEREFSWGQGAARAYALLGLPEEARRALATHRQRAEVAQDHLDLVSVGLSAFFWLHIPYCTDDLEMRRELRTQGTQAVNEAMNVVTDAPDHSLPYFFDGDWGSWWDRLEDDVQFGSAWWKQLSRSLLAQLARYRGNSEMAWKQIKSVLPEHTSTQPGDCNFLAGTTLQRVAADLCLDHGEFDEAQAWLATHDHWLAWADAVLGQTEGRLGWARLHRLSGDAEQARQLAELALEHASDPRQPLALIDAYRFLGQLDVDVDRFDDARRHIQSSLELAERCEAPFEQAQTLLVMAGLATKTGDADEARHLLARVRAICEPLGAKPTLDRADQIEAMLPKRRGSKDYPAGLTQREVDVLRVVAEGKTNAEAAEELFISPRTVSQHLRNTFNKLGVNSRVEATRFAVEEGLVSRRSKE